VVLHGSSMQKGDVFQKYNNFYWMFLFSNKNQKNDFILNIIFKEI